MGQFKWEIIIKTLIPSQTHKNSLFCTLLNPLQYFIFLDHWKWNIRGTSVFDSNHDYVGRGQPKFYENISSLKNLTVKIDLADLEILDENNNIIKQFTENKI